MAWNAQESETVDDFLPGNPGAGGSAWIVGRFESMYYAPVDSMNEFMVHVRQGAQSPANLGFHLAYTSSSDIFSSFMHRVRSKKVTGGS